MKRRIWGAVLDGRVKPVDGMLPAIIAAKKEGFKIVYLLGMKDLPIKHMKGSELRFIERLQVLTQIL